MALRSCRTETELVCIEVWTFRWPETEQGEDFTRAIQQKWGEGWEWAAYQPGKGSRQANFLRQAGCYKCRKSQ